MLSKAASTPAATAARTCRSATRYTRTATRADARQWTPPWYTYVHHGSSDITGLAFYTGASYPPQYRNSLFTADNSRSVIFNIPYVDANADGIPDPPADNNATAFFDGVFATAVQLTSGPGGDIFFPNINRGVISRLSYCDASARNLAPSAAIALDARIDCATARRARSRSPPRTASIPTPAIRSTYDWDLDGDGTSAMRAASPRSVSTRTKAAIASPCASPITAGASDVQEHARHRRRHARRGRCRRDARRWRDGRVPGDVLTYTLVVTNHGENAVPGEAVATTLSPLLTDIAWTCAGSDGASCTPNGSGDIEDSVDLPPGSSVTYTIEATLPSGASGDVDSAARVTAPPGYDDPEHERQRRERRRLRSSTTVSSRTDSIRPERHDAPSLRPASCQQRHAGAATRAAASARYHAPLVHRRMPPRDIGEIPRPNRGRSPRAVRLRRRGASRSRPVRRSFLCA